MQYSYLIDKFKFMGFVDSHGGCAEVWMYEDTVYYCIWFASNKSDLPSTIIIGTHVV